MTEFSPETWRWLMSDAAEPFLTTHTDSENYDTYRHTVYLRQNCGLSPQQASAVVTLCSLRRRATRKFPEAEKMFFTEVGLEQATDTYIAAYKATRFPRGEMAADLCCGVGGDLLALASRGPVLGMDRSHVVAGIAMRNLEICVPVTGKSSRVVCADVADFAKQFTSEEVPFVHIDPDRRPAGVRSTRMEFFSPGEDVLTELLAGRQLTAIKLSPASDIPETWKSHVEREWISRDGECRQQVVWCANMGNDTHSPPAFVKGKHRATIIATAEPTVLRTFTGEPHRPVTVADTICDYLFDPNAAVLAAGLEGALAAEHSLLATSHGAAYLTGNKELTSDAAMGCFAVLETLPMDKKRLRAAVTKRQWATVEIKKRGNVPLPEEVRRWLKLSPGGGSGVIFLMRTSGGALAVLARRLT